MIEQYNHLEGVEMEDDAEKPELPIHVVLGANIFCKIKMKKEPRVGGSGDPVAEITKFGWVLMSPGSEIQSRVYLTNLRHDYDRLCSLDVLGLENRTQGGQDVVYEEFNEQLRRDEEG